MTLKGELLDFYQSSSMQEAVLDWYEFEAGGSALDMTNGVLTALLERRCAKVVQASSTEQLVGESFDYIVLLDPASYDAQRLDLSVDGLLSLRALLKAHGRLLLAYENPQALRYWAGHTAPNTGRSFGTLIGNGPNAYPNKDELIERLASAGFASDALKWYYPLADQWLTTEVYSESHLPNEFFNQRFVDYLDDDTGRRYDERRLHSQVVRLNSFEQMCSAYLVEVRACADDAACTVDYAALTAYRDPAKRFATTINNDGTAHKLPLHSDGLASIKRIVANHQALATAGINVLHYRVDGGQLISRRMSLPTLNDVLAFMLAGEHVPGDASGHYTWSEAEVCRLFDRIRDDIYRAHKRTSKCFWEMVPANIFVDVDARGTQKEFLYFDQEYYAQGVGPDVALVRAISVFKYTAPFVSDPNAQSVLIHLVDRYNLQGDSAAAIELNNLDTHHEVFGMQWDVLHAASAHNAASIDIPTVSVLMPVYNVADYLGGALDSVLAQTMADLEVICVDDGSTDSKTAQLLTRYSLADKRVKVITQTNGGYGKAMNNALAHAIGKYVAIVEPDDYVSPDFLAKNLAACEQYGLDFTKADYMVFEHNEAGGVDNAQIRMSWEPSDYNRVIDPRLELKTLKFPMVTWTGLYNRKFLIANSAGWHETPGAAHQDNGFFWQTHCFGTRMMLLDEPYYHYRQDNPNSSINNKTQAYRKNIEYRLIYDWFKQRPELLEPRKEYYLYHLFHNIYETMGRIDSKFLSEYKQISAGELQSFIETHNAQMTELDKDAQAACNMLLA